MTNPTETARDIADRLMLHVLGDPELLSSLMGRSGITPDQLRALVNGPDIHGFILDFVAESDDRVMQCADATGISAAEIGHAARLLNRRD
ncbi:Protein of unknown function [Paracoccus isoporae]|uniref:DUF3572 domain-containing protein n=1 Tax=Paracoccus isoporae TaxID=591205 RepID=A0A1G7BEZ8_9RHOB|nr:DUF3572 family protein [Paracoccus isoporae]SDE25300.1 Protein of unknown function [Paracoccus isoporae]